VTARNVPPSPRKRTKASSSRKPAGKVAAGSCLCGEVEFELVRSAGQELDCQCARCRRANSLPKGLPGTAHTSNLFLDAAKFRWVRGESQVSTYGPPQDWHFGSAFCRLCGSTLPRVVRSVGIVVVPTGTVPTA
jgi:hypothetical protein